MLTRLAKLIGSTLANAIGEVGLTGFGGDGQAVGQFRHEPPPADHSRHGFINGVDPTAIIGSGFGSFGYGVEFGDIESHKGESFTGMSCYKYILPYELIESQ